MLNNCVGFRGSEALLVKVENLCRQEVRIHSGSISVYLGQNGVGPNKNWADAILPKVHLL
jgi:hypothetical protein